MNSDRDSYPPDVNPIPDDSEFFNELADLVEQYEVGKNGEQYTREQLLYGVRNFGIYWITDIGGWGPPSVEEDNSTDEDVLPEFEDLTEDDPDPRFSSGDVASFTDGDYTILSVVDIQDELWYRMRPVDGNNTETHTCEEVDERAVNWDR